MKSLRRPLVLAAALALSHAHAAEVYFNDFSVDSSGFAGATAVATAPGNGERFLGKLSEKATAKLALSGLAAHDSVTLSFDLYSLDSLDGSGIDFCCGPDSFRLEADGNILLNETFSNVTDWRQSFGGANSPGGTGSVVTRNGKLGYTFFGPDHTYQLSFTFAHTGSTLGLSFVGDTTQEPTDEGFGIDNVRVSINSRTTPVSLPSSLSLAGLALVAAAVTRRR